MNGVFNVLHAVFARVYIFWVLFLHCFNMLCLVFLTFVVVFVVVTSDTTDQSRGSRDSSIFEDSPSNLLSVDTTSRRSTSKCTRTFWALLKCTRTITRYNIVVRGGRGSLWMRVFMIFCVGRKYVLERRCFLRRIARFRLLTVVERELRGGFGVLRIRFETDDAKLSTAHSH